VGSVEKAGSAEKLAGVRETARQSIVDMRDVRELGNFAKNSERIGQTTTSFSFASLLSLLRWALEAGGHFISAQSTYARCVEPARHAVQDEKGGSTGRDI